MAALGTYTKTAAIAVTIDGRSYQVGRGDVDFPITATPCDSEPGTAGHEVGLDVKPALAQLLRDAADSIEAECV